MKKQPEPVLVTPITSKDYFPKFLYGAEVPYRWLQADWWGLALMHYPLLKLPFECQEDWLLYRQIEALATDINVPFPMAVHWTARKALGGDYERAREMDRKRIPWDDQIRYVCRRYSLQSCKFIGPNDAHPLGLVDHMIYPLLLPDEELIYELQPLNALPS